jgi:hypothetical protein
MSPLNKAALAEHVATYRAAYNADLYIFSGDITDETADQFVALLAATIPRRPTAAVFLTTFGGDPDAAFRIGKALRHYYTSVRLLLAGSCKSAGTLIALGANHLAFASTGELGPLDIQLSKPDELMLRGSGLDVLESLSMVTDSAFSSFETFFINLVSRSGGRVSTKTAADVAGRLAARLFEPVMAQIDPLRLGEVKRAIAIARAYGERLSAGTNNLKPATLDTLIEGYPSHGFVIDVDEAHKLFVHVSEMDENECSIVSAIHRAVREPRDPAIILDLGKQVTPAEPVNEEDPTEERHPADHGENVEGEPADSEPHSTGGATAGDTAPISNETLERLLNAV